MQVTVPGTLESRMRGNLHVRFGGGLSEKGGNAPRREPTQQQKRQAEHIEEGYKEKGVSEDEAEARAWATVNKQTGGGKKSGGGRAKKTTRKKASK